MATMVKPKNRIKESSNGNPMQEIQKETTVSLPVLDFQTSDIHIEGISPLIVHAWSAKAVKMMLRKQMKEAEAPREAKNPLEEFRGSLYPVEYEGEQHFGVPAPAFKAAAVTAANSIQLKMTTMRQAFHVNFYTVPIISDPLPKQLWTEWDHKYAKDLQLEHERGISMRMDLVRLETGVADIRFRGSWPKWSTVIRVDFDAGMISLEQLLMLFEKAGHGVGICEWRPSAPQCRSGEFGRFRISRK